MSDPQLPARFGERIRAVLPAAISDACGGMTEAASVATGAVADLVGELEDGHHLHLEMEATAGRQDGMAFIVVLNADDAIRLFDLDPVDPAALGDPTTQLRLLGAFTEAAEAIAEAVGNSLAATGTAVTFRVSGASLEAAAASSEAAASALGRGEVAVCSVVLQRLDGAPMAIVVGAAAPLASLLAGQPGGEPAGSIAANLAARAAARRAAGEPPGLSAVPPPAVTAHPFGFAQIDTDAPSGRPDSSVDLILDVALHVRVELGSTRMTVEEVLALGPGSVVELDRLAGEPVDIVVNDRLIARGEVVVVEENFGVRVTEIIATRGRATAA